MIKSACNFPAELFVIKWKITFLQVFKAQLVLFNMNFRLLFKADMAERVGSQKHST